MISTAITAERKTARPIVVRPLTAEWEPAVREFNQRLLKAPAGVPNRFPTAPDARWLPQVNGASGIYQEYFVATEDRSVRGAYVLKHQDFWLQGRTRSIGNIQLPLSEGLVDRKYLHISVRLLKDAVRRNEYLYALGMGGTGGRFAELLALAGWQVWRVPMYVRVFKPSKALLQLPHFRQPPWRRGLSALLAYSGVSCLGGAACNALFSAAGWHTVASERVERFEVPSQVIWEAAKERYLWTAVRNPAVLNALYPPENTAFIRLVIHESGVPVGWAVLLHRRHVEHPHFGSMRVGALVDCLALPGKESSVVQAATQWLRREGAELIVTNQTHAAWRGALRRWGYLPGPSNFALACSPALRDQLGTAGLPANIHLTRGDGDGPINL